jgi:hypothetical protein
MVQNTWYFDFCLGMEIRSIDMGMVLMVLNLYGPYQDRVSFWDSLFIKPFTKERFLILGGDLNFSLGEAEIWELKDIPDPQSDYFSHKLGVRGLIDIELAKLNPTWRNKRVGEDRIAKIIDSFFYLEQIPRKSSSNQAMGQEWR